MFSDLFDSVRCKKFRFDAKVRLLWSRNAELAELSSLLGQRLVLALKSVNGHRDRGVVVAKCRTCRTILAYGLNRTELAQDRDRWRSHEGATRSPSVAASADQDTQLRRKIQSKEGFENRNMLVKDKIHSRPYMMYINMGIVLSRLQQPVDFFKQKGEFHPIRNGKYVCQA